MKFLLDQDVYANTAHVLSSLGHDAVPVSRIGLSQATDETLLRTAQEQGRIFVTRDRDFGNLVFVKGIRTGVLYLRMLPQTQRATHGEIQRVLETYSEQELQRVLVTVEPGGHRIRRLPDD